MNEFQRVLKELIELFTQLTGIEQVKLEAAAGNHVATVEECMTKEQALTMKLRGLEKEREKYQAEAGYEGMTFHQILEQASEQEAKELLPLFDGLSRVIQMCQEVNEDSQKILKTNLHMIERALKEKEGSTYTGDGKNEAESRHLTNRRV